MAVGLPFDDAAGDRSPPALVRGLGGRGPWPNLARSGWRDTVGQGIFPLPHPPWRNSGWLRRNPGFKVELVPEVRVAVARVLGT